MKSSQIMSYGNVILFNRAPGHITNGKLFTVKKIQIYRRGSWCIFEVGGNNYCLAVDSFQPFIQECEQCCFCTLCSVFPQPEFRFWNTSRKTVYNVINHFKWDYFVNSYCLIAMPFI